MKLIKNMYFSLVIDMTLHIYHLEIFKALLIKTYLVFKTYLKIAKK